MSETVALAKCPIGLFYYKDELCLKTEYGNNEGRIDAYIVSSGEFFWGDWPQTIESQRRQHVRPVDIEALLSEILDIAQQADKGIEDEGGQALRRIGAKAQEGLGARDALAGKELPE